MHHQVGFIPELQGWFNKCRVIMIHPINKMKATNHTITSVDAEKHLTNSASIYRQHGAEYKGKVLQHNKGRLWQTHSQHTQCYKAESFFSKIRNHTRMSTLATFIQHSTRSLSHSSQTRKIKSIQIGKEEVKLSLFTGDMIVCVKNLKTPPRC